MPTCAVGSGAHGPAARGSSCRTFSSRGTWSLYVHLGDLKAVIGIFYGVSPAVIALILHSCYRLTKLGMEDWLQWVIAAVCLDVTVILQAEVALLFIGAGIVGIVYYGYIKRAPVALHSALIPAAMPAATGSTLGKLLIRRKPLFLSALCDAPRGGRRKFPDSCSRACE